MLKPIATENTRERKIDIFRGILMLLMLLDHIRTYWNAGYGIDPLDINATNFSLFFTRWITHICAPAFVFLSGISAYISSAYSV